MKKFNTSIFLVLFILLMTSCATIVTKSHYPVTINSEPSDAQVEIRDRSNILIFMGKTPATVELDASYGFFSKANYSVTITKNGYEPVVVPIEAKLDGWYFGNFLFGGLIGFLIVDPASGAMYKIDNKVVIQKLIKIEGNDDTSMNIININDLPNDLRNNLIKIN